VITENTFNDTYDFDIGRRLSNLPYLRTLGDHINRRVLETERDTYSLVDPKFTCFPGCPRSFPQVRVTRLKCGLRVLCAGSLLRVVNAAT
jgi:hypothetical protein